MAGCGSSGVLLIRRFTGRGELAACVSVAVCVAGGGSRRRFFCASNTVKPQTTMPQTPPISGLSLDWSGPWLRGAVSLLID